MRTIWFQTYNSIPHPFFYEGVSWMVLDLVLKVPGQSEVSVLIYLAFSEELKYSLLEKAWYRCLVCHVLVVSWK